MLVVLDYILNRSHRKLNLDKLGKNYEAILTVKSIAQAQRYYDLIKAIIRGEKPVKLSETIKKVLPDFPKVAITYSVTENEEDSSLNQDKMQEALVDYNAMFGTNFNLANLKSYNKDINDRLARKKERFAFRQEQLDLIIVVDRLLTGFDAPCLSTLFIDRLPMKPQHLIQAFSRTNRLYNDDKKRGHIVTFQKPNLFKERVDEALRLYSNGGETSVLAPTWEEELENFMTSHDEFRALAPTPDQALDPRTATDKELKDFVKAFQTFDKYFASIQVYQNYDETEILNQTGLTEELLEDYHAHYENAIEELRSRRLETADDEEAIDIDYELSSIHTDEINYHYIITLMQRYLDITGTEDSSDLTAKDRASVSQFIQELDRRNPQLAELLGQVWTDIQSDTENYRGESVAYMLDQQVAEVTDRVVHDLANKWYLGTDELRFVVDNYRHGRDSQVGEKDVTASQDYEAYKLASGEDALSKLKYRKAVKEDITKTIEEKILPLREQ